MVTLIHGDNQKSALDKLVEMKQSFQGEILELEAKEQSLVNFREILSSSSLFATEKLIQLNGITTNLELLTDFEIIPNTELVLYEQKQLTKVELSKLQKLLPNLKVEQFKLDATVFKFVESLAPGNQKEIISFWQKYISQEEPEIALAMIARQIRLLIASSENQSGLDEFDNLAPWQKQRLSVQAKKFSLKELLTLHQKLLETDHRNKTGQTPLDLASSLELILLTM